MTWLSVTEAARTAGVGPDTIRRWADRGRVDAIRTAGGHRRVDSESLVSILRQEPRAGRDIGPVDALDQFCADAPGWFGWEPPSTWSIERSDEFLSMVAEVEREMVRLRGAVHEHLDRIGG